jgi:hypothetical protein
MERAQQAIEEGRFDEAEAALAEAREVGKDAHDVEVLEAVLASRRNPVVTLPPDLPLNDTAVSESFIKSPRRGWSVAAAATVVVAAGAGFGYARYWPAPVPAAPPVAKVAAAPVVPVATSGAPIQDRIARLNIVRETITAQIATPRLGEDELPKLPPYPAPPIASPAPEPDPVVMAVNRSEPEPPPSTPLDSRPTLPVESQPGPAAPPPPLRAFIPDSSPMTALRPEAPPTRTENPAARETAAPAEPVVRDETVVLSVLQRYESAYSNLDAAAASAVWPAVDRGALARAFNGLASQRVSLGDCDISVNGPSARATCSGSATWRPKVGGGSHTENRRWNFELRKAGESWKIERAVIR